MIKVKATIETEFILDRQGPDDLRDDKQLVQSIQNELASNHDTLLSILEDSGFSVRVIQLQDVTPVKPALYGTEE